MQLFFPHAKIACPSSFATEDELTARNKEFSVATRMRSPVDLPSENPQHDRPLIYVVRAAVFRLGQIKDLRGGWELFFVSLTAQKTTIRWGNLARGELPCRRVGVLGGRGVS